MSSEPVISMQHVGKYYEIYQKPEHRLWQMLLAGRKKFYHEHWACADINLDVQKGECLGIIGRNGAGKSTLLQLMAGTLTPSSGRILVNGRVAALLELGSGFNPEFSGRDNVFLNAAILGLSTGEIRERFPAIAEFADIGDFIDRPVKTYSSGMTLRLAFAVMANVDADILIIDEALAVGDAFFTQKCMRFLRDFMARNTVVFVSHDTNAVCSLCTRALLLEAGRLKLAGSPREVSRKYLEDLYAERQEKVNLTVPAESRKWSEPIQDMRREIYNGSTLRNDIEIFQFNQEEAGFGTGNASITEVWLANAGGERYAWIVGGEVVFLHIVCSVNAPVNSPVVGFIVANSWGQQLFGDNTWLAFRDKLMELTPGEKLHVTFKFQMPVLACGEYFVTAAIGEGTPENHIQHHWRHDAMIFQVHSSSLAGGIVGTPMLAIEMEKA